MKKIKLFIILLLVAVFNFNTTAQNSGDNDPTFNTTDVGFDNGIGASGSVETTALQLDGKIIIGGNFTSYNGIAINRIARLNINGDLDGTFVVGTGVNTTVNTTAVQPDGKIIIGGDFITYNGIAKKCIARLNIDGTLDSTFNSGIGASSTVITTSIQADGKIIIGGNFTSYNGIARNRIARLNTDGTLDGTFNPGSGASNAVRTTAIQADGKIIIGGDFTIYNGIARNRIVRLNTDGTLDTAFNTGTGVSWYLSTISIQPDGKIIIGGNFASYNGTVVNKIARLNIDGTLDSTFITGTGADLPVNSTTIQPDGKIIIGGDFTTYNGTYIRSIARLNTDGTIDSNFIHGDGASNVVRTTAIQPDGKIIIGGNFSTYNFYNIMRITRLNTDGTLNQNGVADSEVWTTAIQPDGKIIIGGGFSAYNGTARYGITRLNTDGTLDGTFNTGTGANYFDVITTALQPDGKIIIGGDFPAYNGIAINRIARLNTDGTLDTTFSTGTGADNPVYTTAIQSDGKIIIGGGFTSYNGIAINRIARLNIDGTLDTSFNIGTGVNLGLNTTAIQADGKIIIGGTFTTYNGTFINNIARLNTDGTLDGTFNVGTGTDYSIQTITIQADGKIIIGGDFTFYNGTYIERIARLNTDGTLDGTFTTGTGANSYVNSITIQPDGKIIIGGAFTTYNGITNKSIARLNTDGTLDNAFTTGTGTGTGASFSYVNSTTIQADGKIIIGGWFTSYNGIDKNGITRLNNCINTFSTDTVTACNSLTWIDGNTYTSSTNTPTFILPNAVGCDSTITLNLTVNNLIASYSSIDNTNGNYSFTNTSTGNFNQTHWAFGDGTTSTAANPNHTFSANGTYVVVLTVNNSTSSSCMDYYLDTIVVNGVVAPLQCAAGFVMYPDAGGVTVVNSSTGTNLTYLWSFGDGDTSTLQFPTHTYVASGPYYLCLTVDDGAGCVDMYCDSIGENGVVFNKQTGFTINVIAPPLATQVSEQAAITSAISVYPNPTGKKLHVVFNKSEPYQLKIVTIDGKLIETKTIVGNATLDVSNYSSGMYFITATNNEGKVYQSKFVKE